MTKAVRIRASSLSELFDCARRWQAKHLDGLRLPASGAAHLGTSLHAGTAAFDAARLAGTAISSDDAAGVLIETLYRPQEDVDWEDESPRSVEAIALTLHSRYCADIAPQREYAGVEVLCESLRVDLPDSRITIELTGTTDRVRRTADGQFAISDVKSGKRAVGADGRAVTSSHGLQIGVYELLTEAAIGKPITAPAEIVGLQTTSKPRVGTAEITGARDRLVGMPGEPGMLEHVGAILATGLFPPNPRSMLCSPKYCPLFARCRAHD